MDSLTADCSVCGGGIESAGLDESSRLAVKAWIREHAEHKEAPHE